MQYLTKSDLRRLARLCKAEYSEAQAVMASDDASLLEKACADNAACWMAGLASKLEDIAASNARRIEITW